MARKFRAEAINITCYLINCGPYTCIDCKTPYEVWSSKPANYSSLKVFGFTVYYYVNKSKLEPRTKTNIFLGFGNGVKRYRVWSPYENRIILIKNVIFYENSMLNLSVKLVAMSNDVRQRSSVDK